MCEIRWSDSGDIRMNGYSVYYFSSLNDTHQNGMVVILKNDVTPGSLLAAFRSGDAIVIKK